MGLFSMRRMMRVKKAFAGIIVVLVAAYAINSCNDLDSSDVNQAQSSSQVVEYKEVPKVTGVSLQQAVKTLQDSGFTAISAFTTDDSGENKTPVDLTAENYHVSSQDPYGESKEYTDTTVNLTVHENKSRTISNIIAVGEQLSSAMDKLHAAGYRTCDYTLDAVYGSYTEYYILEVRDGDDSNLPFIKTESYAQKKARERLNTPDEELAHGGAFCSEEGATAFSDRSTATLTCSVASDGRLRWML